MRSLAFILLRSEQRREHRNVGHGFGRERSPRLQMLLIAQRTRMVGRKEPSRSEAVMHLFEVRCARQYVVVRVIRVERPSPYRTPGSTQVGGMICISPIARRLEVARSSLALSICMAAPIQRVGTAKGSDAFAMNPANRSAVSALDPFRAHAPVSKRGKAVIGHTRGMTPATMRAIPR